MLEDFLWTTNTHIQIVEGQLLVINKNMYFFKITTCEVKDFQFFQYVMIDLYSNVRLCM